jgi:phenylalanyl-tRNA synthetase beta chain
MVISYNWLLEYLPDPLPINELSNILTSIGLEVEHIETVETIKGSLEGLVIGEVLTCEKHPNADKLSVTTVSIGGETPLNIVCGAPNVAAGQRVVVAPVGVKVHPVSGEAFEIKKAKIRGADSEGMICAEDEIGLGTDHQGIMVLPADAPLGTWAKDYFNIPAPEFAIHIGLTPNRSDAMSHIGVARDVGAYLTHHRGGQYEINKPLITLNQFPDAAPVKVNILDADACPRYCGLSITGVTVGESPDWLKRKLNTIGVRSINNIVDITNFVLHEYGQPLHAFNADAISGNEVNVKLANAGSKFKTLDEKEITLTATDLMICNAQEPMCLAGVYGGAYSGVTAETKTIFLESAYFHPSFIRRSSLHHGLRTDAATHFEKGVDMNNVVPALLRAATLIIELAGGTISSNIVDNYPVALTPVTVNTTYDYINKLSGKDYPKEAVNTILAALGFELNINGNALSVLVPSNKTDVLQPADIVEEIVRIDGLDNIIIPEKLNIALLPSQPNDRRLKEKCAEMLCGEGLQEIVTNSVTNSNYYPGNEQLVKMINSLSSELDIMRPSMLESGLEVISYNLNRKNSHLALFEFGKAYTTENSAYREEEQLALWFTGNAVQSSWNAKAKPFDLSYVKGIIQNLFTRNGISKLTVSYESDAVLWKYKNQPIASISKTGSDRLKTFDVKQDVFFAVVYWEQFLKAAGLHKIKYTEVPKFPSMQRDLAIVLDKTITYQQVQQATEQLNIQSLQDYDLFDVFENEKIGADKKSYALSYTFQLHDRTLTDVEIEQHMQALIKTYETKLNAMIRK